jgi:hypothetical protein
LDPAARWIREDLLQPLRGASVVQLYGGAQDAKNKPAAREPLTVID